MVATLRTGDRWPTSSKYVAPWIILPWRNNGVKSAAAVTPREPKCILNSTARKRCLKLNLHWLIASRRDGKVCVTAGPMTVLVLYLRCNKRHLVRWRRNTVLWSTTVEDRQRDKQTTTDRMTAERAATATPHCVTSIMQIVLRCRV